MNILDEIVAKTKSKLEEKKQGLSLEELSSKIDFENLKETNFKKSLQNKAEAIIAEIKKASPSAGIISDNFDPVLKSKEYESFGASALSILTEEDYFLGNIEYIKDVKAITSLPILRKDFIVDEYQIYESKLIGADCILLIASILNDEELKNFSEIAERLKLDYIIEVHDEEELQRVQHFSNAIIGVNNRNLKTFDVDINNSVELKKIFQRQQKDSSLIILLKFIMKRNYKEHNISQMQLLEPIIEI